MIAPIRFINLRMAPEGDCTQLFGVNQALYAQFGINGHNGIDLVRPYGEKMFAIEDADVVEVRNDPNGFGKHLRIISKTPDKNGYCNEWTYGHNSANYVQIGDEVKAGQHICDMGNTGFVVSNANGNGFWNINPFAGTHVHLGLRKVKRVKTGGWSYSGSNIRIQTINYNNGFKGAIDPRPLLEPLSTTAPLPNRSIFQQLLRIQDLINKIKQ